MSSLQYHLISFAITGSYNKRTLFVLKKSPDLLISITQITNGLSNMFLISPVSDIAADRMRR